DYSTLVFDTNEEMMHYYEKVVNQYKEKYPHNNNQENKEKSQVSELLPFLEEEDLREIVQSIINEGENSEYRSLDLEDLAGYLSDQDLGELFLKGTLEKNPQIDPVVLAPYVSDKYLTNFVDAYLEGKCWDVDIDELYPYLNGRDIKRLFRYFLSKKKEKVE
ncbi:MAG: hypothetical protein K2K15_05770, partial [Anaeroplasmataceae bacterium]|nr:hypothetical protein [Anaeroplasmataceae bacterium]